MEEPARYLIQDPIGTGGTASVFRGWDQQLGRWVAIKRLAEDPDVEAAIRKEAEILAALNHPNIVTIYDFGADALGPFVVMELVNGKTLDDIAAGKPLTIPQFSELVNQVCRGVSAAHSRGLVHRDLKPGNLMLHFHEDGSFTVKILDFGLARTADEITLEDAASQESVMGSAFTISPEQLQRMPADVRSDVYSLGVVFYFALTGHYPYENSDIHSMIEAHLAGSATPAHLRRPGISQRLSHAIAKMMAVEPAERVQSAEDARQLIRNSMHPERPAEPVIVPTVFKPRNKKLREFGLQLFETLCLSAAVAFVVVKLGYLKEKPATTPPAETVTETTATPDQSPGATPAGPPMAASATVNPLDLADLGKHVGQIVAIEGTAAALVDNEVLKVRNLSFSAEEGKSLVISFPADEFTAEKAQSYSGKHIRVTGPLSAYFNTYRIIAHADTRIEVLPDGASASAAPADGPVVSPTDLAALETHLGQPVIVEGKTTVLSEEGVLRFRNLGFEGEAGKTLILGFPMDNFPPEKAQTYVGKRVRVKGVVTRYFDAFRLVLHPDSPIQILGE